MRYEGTVFRPPSEADSLILQVTIGCSHNRCTFCGAYKEKHFRIRSLEEVQREVDEVRPYAAIVRRIFLADGDALIVPQRMLVPMLESIREALPRVERIGVYGNTKSILRKSPEELAQLRELGIGIVYLGVESGDQEVLDRVHKGTCLDDTAAAIARVKAADMRISVSVLLGLGGVERSQIHAERTGQFLARVQPDFGAALSVMVVPGTPLAEEEAKGAFTVPDAYMMLQELHTMLSQIEGGHMYFASNHASNYLPIKGWIPEEKGKLLQTIEHVLRAKNSMLLRPEFLRGL
jgi:radical SAM superfamily enzyme YgiQ (UPF0313 family)